LGKLAVALASPDRLPEAAATGADLAELRLDLFDGTHDLRRVIEGRPLPLIATLRPPREGGRYDGPDAERLRVLLAAARLGAEYVDLEWDAVTPAALDDLRAAGARVIVSRHAFDRMPDLERWAGEIAALGPDVVKVVGTARDARDCAPALRALARAERPTIAIAMGEAGVATRVLALRYERCFLTFAALPAGGTAPGQVTIDEMLRVYRARSIGPGTAVYGLFGPTPGRELVENENRRLVEEGLDAVAVPFPTTGDPAAAVEALRELPLADWRIVG
jgi:3-dehydroquinate dehydratase/shikimate dehydrogenase